MCAGESIDLAQRGYSSVTKTVSSKSNTQGWPRLPLKHPYGSSSDFITMSSTDAAFQRV